MWTICSCRWGFVDGVQVAVMESAEMPKICHPNWPVRMVRRTLSCSDTQSHKHYLVQILTRVDGPLIESQAHSLALFSDNTTALTLSWLDSETQGQFHCIVIWHTTKCIIIVIFYHLIFAAPNRSWANNLLTCLKWWTLWAMDYVDLIMLVKFIILYIILEFFFCAFSNIHHFAMLSLKSHWS